MKQTAKNSIAMVLAVLFSKGCSAPPIPEPAPEKIQAAPSIEESVPADDDVPLAGDETAAVVFPVPAGKQSWTLSGRILRRIGPPPFAAVGVSLRSAVMPGGSP